MGMIDSEVIFSNGQTPTAIGDTASTNVYNTGGANGQGDAGQTSENLWLNARCTAAATSAGSATVQAVVQDSADNATFADVTTGAVVALANITAGSTLLAIQPPPGMRQYWRIVYRIGTAVLTAGSFDAYVSNTLQRNVARPSGIPAVG